jgi:hypothetical protein
MRTPLPTVSRASEARAPANGEACAPRAARLRAPRPSYGDCVQPRRAFGRWRIPAPRHRLRPRARVVPGGGLGRGIGAWRRGRRIRLLSWKTDNLLTSAHPREQRSRPLRASGPTGRPIFWRGGSPPKRGYASNVDRVEPRWALRPRSAPKLDFGFAPAPELLSGGRLGRGLPGQGTREADVTATTLVHNSRSTLATANMRRARASCCDPAKDDRACWGLPRNGDIGHGRSHRLSGAGEQCSSLRGDRRKRMEFRT